MADFCRQCTEIDGLPGGDYATGQGNLQGLTTLAEWAEGLARLVLCEGCGPILVDPDGNCVSDDCLRNGHHVPSNEPLFMDGASQLCVVCLKPFGTYYTDGCPGCDPDIAPEEG
jgi:hypothetical protein